MNYQAGSLLVGSLVCCLCGEVALAQPETLWFRSYDVGYGRSVRQVIQTNDGGFALAGTTMTGEDSTSVFLIKTDGEGTIQWHRIIGDRPITASALVQSDDGGYVLTGTSRGANEDTTKVVLMKLDAEGDLQWQRRFVPWGASGSARSLAKTPDGGYAVAGWIRLPESIDFAVHNQAFLARTDPTGHVMWDTTYAGEGYAVANAMIVPQTGGFVLAGLTRSSLASPDHAFLLKANSDATVAWQRSFGGGVADWIYAVKETDDGGYIVTGWTGSFGDGDNDVYLARTEADGTLIWQRAYGGHDTDQGQEVIQDADGGFVFTGMTESFVAGDSDIYLVKTDADGTVRWEKTLGGAGSDAAYSLLLAHDGGYVLAGMSDSLGIGEGFLAKIASSFPLSDRAQGDLPAHSRITESYPNPFNHQTRIAFVTASPEAVVVEVVNILGQRVRQWAVQLSSAGRHEILWDGADDSGRPAPSGPYVCRLHSKDTVSSHTLMLLR